MIFGVTERPEYKRCRFRWDMGSRNRQNLTPVVPTMALGLGTICHSAFEMWAKEPEVRLEDHFMRASLGEVERAKDAYHSRVGTYPADHELGPLLESVLLGRNMMANYQDYWGSLMPEGYEVVATEQRIQVAIPGTEHQSEWIYEPDTGIVRQHIYPDVRLHYLEGRLDMIMRRVSTGALYVRDYKTYSSRPNEEDLFHNDQFLAYVWLATQLDIGPVAGLAYDGIWKRAGIPKKVDNRAGVLADLFCRIRIERPVDELVRFQTLLALEALEMADNPAIYTNHMWDGSCRWGCNYKDVCYATDRGEDADFLKRTRYILRPAADEVDDGN